MLLFEPGKQVFVHKYWVQFIAYCGRNRLLTVLLCVLIFLCGVWAGHTGRVWLYERQLKELAQDVIEKEWMESVGGAEPQSTVQIKATCTFSHLVFGERSGKVSLIFVPRPCNESRVVSEVLYYYVDHGAGWEQSESFGHAIGRVR